MQDRDIDIYGGGGTSLGGYIREGCLILKSEVYGDDYESERNYKFTKEDTEKLFSIISIEDFIELCKRERVRGMEKFLHKNGIHPTTVTF